MNYVEQLMANLNYLEMRKKLDEKEKDRIFCKHGLEHSLDVARIAQLMNLELELQENKEEIYLTALLHDLGRVEEYEKEIPHEEASANIARKLLAEIHYPEEKWQGILQRILEHRHLNDDHEEITQENFFWFADKKARNCFACDQRENCKWKTEKMTKNIEW